MSSYYYRLGKNKTLNYSTAGKFSCPVLIEAEKTATANGKEYIGDHVDHERHQRTWTGENHVEYIPSVKKELPNGDRQYTQTRIIKKVTKDRKDLFCVCGRPMQFVGYLVYIEKIVKPGREAFKVMGTPVMMDRDTRRIASRYFVKKTSQQKYVKQQLAKART